MKIFLTKERVLFSPLFPRPLARHLHRGSACGSHHLATGCYHPGSVTRCESPCLHAHPGLRWRRSWSAPETIQSSLKCSLSGWQVELVPQPCWRRPGQGLRLPAKHTGWTNQVSNSRHITRASNEEQNELSAVKVSCKTHWLNQSSFKLKTHNYSKQWRTKWTVCGHTAVWSDLRVFNSSCLLKFVLGRKRQF